MKWERLGWVSLGFGFIGALGTVSSLGLAAQTVFGIGTIISIACVAFFEYKSQQDRLVKVGRDDVIERGRHLIRGAVGGVVMFGGDLSWAPEYAEAIRDAVDNGRKVVVLHPQTVGSPAHLARNVETLLGVGAEVYETKADCGLRATLVNPDTPGNTLLYVVSYSLKAGPRPTRGAVKEDYEYAAKVYREDEHWPLVRAMRTVRNLMLEGATKH